MKAFGLILIFISSVFLGLYFAFKKRSDLIFNKKTLQMLYELKGLIRFNQPNKSELISLLNRLGYGACLERIKDNTLVDDYMSRLGTRDLKSEIESIEQCIERFEKYVCDLEKDMVGYCKLSIGVGLLSGTFIVVILI